MNYIIDSSKAQKSCCVNYIILAIFILATIAIWLLHLNEKLFYIVNAWHVFLPNQVWNIINIIAYPKVFILPILLIILTSIFNREQLKKVVILLVAYYVIFFVLKLLVHEARPFVVLPPDTIFFLLNHQDVSHNRYLSFPSGHTGIMVVFAFAAIKVLKINNKLAKFILFLLPIIVGVTRLATGWHWPIDVLASGIIGYILVEIFFFNNKCTR